MSRGVLSSGIIGVIVGILAGLIQGFLFSGIIIIIIPAILGSYIAGFGSRKGSEDNKPNAGACLIFGVLTTVMVIVASYYLMPVTRVTTNMGYGYTSSYRVAATPSEIVSLDYYLASSMTLWVLLEAFLGSSIGYVLVKRNRRNKPATETREEKPVEEPQEGSPAVEKPESALVEESQETASTVEAPEGEPDLEKKEV